MPKISNSQRGRRIQGTNMAVMKESAAGGMRKLRSPLGGQQLAVPTPDGRGGTVLKTPDGKIFKTRKL